MNISVVGLLMGNVEKSHQRRSRHFVVLTYWKYAPRGKQGLSPSGYPKPFAALLDAFFDHSRRLLVLKSSRAYTGFFARNIQQALMC
jgi:hypothetical protein